MSDPNSILQRQVNALLTRVAQLEGKPVSVGVPLQVRLAVTRPQPGGSYPNPATNPDSYWLRFTDGTFTEAQGAQTVTKYQRNAVPTVVARNVNGSASFVQQDSLVLAVRYSNRWWFSYSAPGMNLYPVYFNAALTRGGSASVTIMQWNAGLGVLQATGATVTAYDVCKSGPANQFDIGYVVLNPDSNRYEIVELPSRTGAELFPCYFNGDLARGSNVSANVGAWVAGAWDLSGNPQTIYDEGRVGPAKQGWRGWVFLSPTSGRWELLNIERSPLALWIEYTVAVDFNQGTSPFLVNVTRFWEGPDPGAQVFVANVGPPIAGKYVFRGKAGSRGRAQYDRYTGTYRNDWTECPDGAINEPNSQSMASNNPPPPATPPAFYFPGAGTGF